MPPHSAGKDEPVFSLVRGGTPAARHGSNEPVAPKEEIIVDQPNKEPDE